MSSASIRSQGAAEAGRGICWGEEAVLGTSIVFHCLQGLGLLLLTLVISCNPSQLVPARGTYTLAVEASCVLGGMGG